MKYNKFWKYTLATDHVFQCKRAQRCVLSYNDWKQRCKEPTTLVKLNWCLYLTRECEKLDSRIFKQPRAFFCSSNSQCLSDDEKLKICDLNKKTLYKICKKVDKLIVQKGDGAMKWYTKMCSMHRFKFLGGPELGRLRIRQQNGADHECPICFDSLTIECDPVVVECGHAFCAGCAAKMWRGNAKGAACPICRFPVSGFKH